MNNLDNNNVNKNNLDNNNLDNNDLDNNSVNDNVNNNVNNNNSKKKTNNSGSMLHQNKAMRWLFMLLGVIFFIIGIIGAILPGLPTTIFMILAAGCWAKGSERFHNWILAHPIFGKVVLDWRENRAMPRKAKYMAWSMMTISCSFMFYRMPTRLHWVAWATTICCLAVSIWMAKLPDS